MTQELEALKGNRKGQYSIRINSQFRVCFVWTENGSSDVEIVDYHWKIIMRKATNHVRPVHPGEILREDFLVPLNRSVNALALALNVPATRIHEIVKERRSISADTAERLARYFGGDATFWLDLQAIYDLKTLPTRDEITRRVEPCSIQKMT